MHRLLTSALFAVIIVAANATDSPAAEPSVVGTWKLLSFYSEDVPSGNRVNPLGEHPRGFLSYDAQGRMSTLIVHEKRSPPKTDADRIDLHKFMFGYMGRYTVEGDKVTHHVEVSWNELWTGTNQVRFFKIEGDKLYIRSAVQPSVTRESVMQFGMLVFERVK